MNKTAWLVAVACVALIGAGFAYADQAAVAEGAKVYAAQKCKLCHSIAGAGSKKNPLDGVGKKLGAADIKKWITNPKEMKADTKMKAYPNLPAKDLDALVGYLASLK
jgi:mono/diheme cytochrome c family protein